MTQITHGIKHLTKAKQSTTRLVMNVQDKNLDACTAELAISDDDTVNIMLNNNNHPFKLTVMCRYHIRMSQFK